MGEKKIGQLHRLDIIYLRNTINLSVSQQLHWLNTALNSLLLFIHICNLISIYMCNIHINFNEMNNLIFTEQAWAQWGQLYCKVMTLYIGLTVYVFSPDIQLSSKPISYISVVSTDTHTLKFLKINIYFAMYLL
jgi:hypothetical protein